MTTECSDLSFNDIISAVLSMVIKMNGRSRWGAGGGLPPWRPISGNFALSSDCFRLSGLALKDFAGEMAHRA